MEFEEIRIENTNACSFKCYFCPREKLSRKRGFMPLEDLDLVLDRIGQHNGLVDLHGFGEPLLDDVLPSRVSAIVCRWPSSIPRIYTTAGVEMTERDWHALLDAGLRRIEISMYGASQSEYKRIHGIDRFEFAKKSLEALSSIKSSYPKCEVFIRMFPEHDLHRLHNTEDEIERHSDWLGSLGFANVRHRTLHNFGNGRSYNREGLQTCSVVHGYRKRILQVTWDLNVIPCCFDFNATVVFGNLKTSSLEDIFCSEAYLKFISAHLSGNLSDYPICASCEKCSRP